MSPERTTGPSRMTRNRLSKLLTRLPRARIATTPTPLIEVPRFSRELGGPRIFIKRDDLTGLAFGGNKIRQLEFFIGDALSARADVLIAGGSFAQSNHSRAAAAAARAVGMTPVIAVQPGGNYPGPVGNALLTHLLASDVRIIQELAEAPRIDRLAEVAFRRKIFERLAEEYRGNGRTPYIIVGTSVPLGVMGYVVATIELREQFDALGIEPDWICVTSMGATQAGLVLGRQLLGESYFVAGMAYQPADGSAGRWVAALAKGAAALIGVDPPLEPDDVVNDDREAGDGYGVLSDNARAAFQLLLRTEGLFLDPVYTAKGMAGLIRWIREGRIAPHETVVFVHTGGLPATFAYGPELLSGTA